LPVILKVVPGQPLVTVSLALPPKLSILENSSICSAGLAHLGTQQGTILLPHFAETRSPVSISVMDKNRCFSVPQVLEDIVTEPFGRGALTLSSLQKKGHSILESIGQENPSECGKMKRRCKQKRVHRRKRSEPREMMLMHPGVALEANQCPVHTVCAAPGTRSWAANQSTSAINVKDAPWKMEASVKVALPANSICTSSMDNRFQSMPHEHSFFGVPSEASCFLLRL